MANKLLQQVRADVEQFLLAQSKLFSNESDLQLRLSNYLMNFGHYDQVEVEYYVPIDQLKQRSPSLASSNFPWKSSLHIDIVVEKGGQFVPVELKYTTRKIDGSFSRFGVEVQTRVPKLRNNGAQSFHRYNYWKDVRRIEALCKAYAATTAGGLAVMVSNDPAYLNEPTANSVGYARFSIKEGRDVKQPHDPSCRGRKPQAQSRNILTSKLTAPATLIGITCQQCRVSVISF